MVVTWIHIPYVWIHIRCVLYLAHSDEEKAAFAGVGLVEALVDMLYTTQFGIQHHVLRALLCLAKRTHVPGMIIDALDGDDVLNCFLDSSDPVLKDLSAQLLLKLDLLEEDNLPATSPFVELVRARRHDLKVYQRNILDKYERDFTPEQLDDFRHKFVEFDADNSGSIDIDELRAMFLSCGVKVKPAKLKKLLKEMDIDKSGDVEWKEFIRVIHELTIKRKSVFSQLMSFTKSAVIASAGVG